MSRVTGDCPRMAHGRPSHGFEVPRERLTPMGRAISRWEASGLHERRYFEERLAH